MKSVALLLVACVTAFRAASAQADLDRSVLGFPEPVAGLEIGCERDDGSRSTLLDLVRQYEQVTGQLFVLNGDVVELLEKVTLESRERVMVPPRRVHRAFESVLAEHDFALTIRNRAPRILSVCPLRTAQRQVFRRHATFAFVPAEALGELEDHPALLARTVLRFPGVDVRKLSNRARTWVTDTHTAQVIPLGITDALYVAGLGARIGEFLALLEPQWTPDPSSSLGAPEASGDPCLWFPVPWDSSEIASWFDADSPRTLLDITESYGRATEQSFVFDETTRKLLASQSANLGLPVEFAPERIHTVFECLLREFGFSLAILEREEPRLLTILAPEDSVRALSCGIYVPMERLYELSDHPALLVNTRLNVPGVDARQLSNSMRSLAIDRKKDILLPIGQSEFVIGGRGSWVMQVAQILSQVAEPPSAHGLSTASEWPLDLDGAAQLEKASSRPVVIGPETTLDELVRSWRAASGLDLSIAANASPGGISVGVLAAVTVPPRRVNAFLQAILAYHDWVLVPRADGGYLLTPRGEAPDIGYLEIPAEELEQFGDAHALGIVVRFSLPMRTRNVMKTWLKYLPIESEIEGDTLVVKGRGADLARCFRPWL